MHADHYDGAGNVALLHGAHRFTARLADFAFARRPDGTPDPAIVLTPELACLDCGIAAQASFPAIGDRDAALLHAHARVALGLVADLAAAVAAVAALRAGKVWSP